MYLVLGSPHDACVTLVADALEAAGQSVALIDNPLAAPARFAWRFEAGRLQSTWTWHGRVEPVDGVLVRGGGWLSPDGWQAADHAYMQAEMFAALVAWLRSLPCPVINRYRADLWYRPQIPLVAWHRDLAACGLPTADVLITNDPVAARAFGARRPVDDVEGVVYGPLSSEACYLASTDDDWRGLEALQQRTPVCLTRPHDAPRLACVVGQRVFWDGPPPADDGRLVPGLLQLAASAGLRFVEVALARTADGPAVVGVDHHPRLERYPEPTRAAVVHALIEALTASTHTTAARAMAEEVRS